MKILAHRGIQHFRWKIYPSPLFLSYKHNTSCHLPITVAPQFHFTLELPLFQNYLCFETKSDLIHLWQNLGNEIFKVSRKILTSSHFWSKVLPNVSQGFIMREQIFSLEHMLFLDSTVT